MAQTRALNRRWDAQSAPPDLAASGVALINWPTKQQYELWWSFVRQPLVVSEDGWWMAACPRHDPTCERPEATAEFMFRFGSFRCLADDGEPCHPNKSAGTLNSLRHLVDQGEQFVAAPEVDWDEPLSADEQAEIDAERARLDAMRSREWRRNPKGE